MKIRWKILIGLGIFMVLSCTVTLLTLHVGSENEVEAYKKLLRERGEKLEISEVLPPLVSPESNGVAIVRSAFALFVSSLDDWTNLPSAMRMVAPGKAMVGWEQPDVRGYDFTNSWENAIAQAEADKPTTGLLKQALTFSVIDFQPEYSKGPDMLLPHLALLKRGTQKLSAAAICDLHAGNAAAATTNLCAALALVHGVHGERTMISQLVRIAMASIAASASWELLQSTNLTDESLAMLQKRWESLEFVQPLENSILMERASHEMTIAKMRASSAEFRRITGLYSSYLGMSAMSGSSGSGNWWEEMENFAKEGIQKAKFTGSAVMWRTSWTYSDELNALKNDQDLLETLRLIETNQFFQPAYSNLMSRLYPSGMSRLHSSGGAAGIYEEVWDGLDDMNLRQLFSSAVGSLTATVRKTMVAEACKRIVITAIALKRFQLKHGNLPEKLSELSPEFLAAVPLDAVDGKPLRYRRNSDGTFLLYSIGEDGIDDGGDPSLPTGSTSRYFSWQGNKVHDWVWPQPATPAEVQFFYDHPPK